MAKNGFAGVASSLAPWAVVGVLALVFLPKVAKWLADQVGGFFGGIGQGLGNLWEGVTPWNEQQQQTPWQWLTPWNEQQQQDPWAWLTSGFQGQWPFWNAIWGQEWQPPDFHQFESIGAQWYQEPWTPPQGNPYPDGYLGWFL